jgi:hypothetical protein
MSSPSIQEEIAQAVEDAKVHAQRIFDLEERARRKRDEDRRDKILKENAIEEARVQLQVYEEVSGLGKMVADAMGIDDAEDASSILYAMVYLWRHPSQGSPITETTAVENMARYRKECEKMKKVKRKV